MFHRRLKIFLVAVLVVTGLLMLRALQFQVFYRSQWTERAAKVFAPPAQLVETTRGRILDFKGREIAADAPCMDLSVDYRAIAAMDRVGEATEDFDKEVDKWIKGVAIRRLEARGESTKQSAAVQQEIVAVKEDLRGMWGVIAKVSGKSLEEIEQIRLGIVQRVEMRRRYAWVHRWRAAVVKEKGKAIGQTPWYQKWLMGEGGAEEAGVDNFDLVVGEQRIPQVVLHDVGDEVGNYFGKDPDKYPGLVMQPGAKRVYPYEEAGCHLIGHLGLVDKEDLLADESEDELRKLWRNDVVGKTGVEALAEPVLRGSRGRVVKVNGVEKERIDPKPGQDVRITIDIELQREMQRMYRDVILKDPDKTFSRHTMHGAAVVIDVPTGEVRAMASYPDYDNNRMDEDYAKLAMDGLNMPLMNRATQAAREPGSTAKPMVGVSAITAGVIPADFKVECTGYLIIDGKHYGFGRCWVASGYENIYGKKGVAHHPFPLNAPHPTGFLTFEDALERSCNIYFENVGNLMGIERESEWFRKFGLGRSTGIGIAEMPGYVPGDFPNMPESEKKMTSWLAGIGQGHVKATPLQMANVVATIARDGVWVRPHLMTGDDPALPARKPSTRPVDQQAPAEDRIDLHLSKVALAEAKQGMVNVVYGAAGTGKTVAHTTENDNVLEPELVGLRIAGKTGTAQAGHLPVKVKGPDGKVTTELLQPTLTGQNGGEMDWYRSADLKGEKINHAWFVGFAPADKPKLAFAVLVEYGEKGGDTAGRLAKRVVEACVKHGYLAAGLGSKEVANGE